MDVALTIHYYEALLACLAILVWHFYHVMFDPDIYPLNPACWDGHVSQEWQEAEHPLEHQIQPAPASSNAGESHSDENPRPPLPLPSQQQSIPLGSKPEN